MSPDEYLRQRLDHHLPDEPGKPELIALLLPLLAMGTRQSAATWQGLREEVAQAVVLALKDDADRVIFNSWIELLDRGEKIIEIGEARNDLAIQALGTMVKADALKLVTGRLEEAWLTFDHAGYLYRASRLATKDKEIGWARTRIGRVYICAEMGQREKAFAEAEQAHEILERYEVWDRLFFLHYLWGTVCNTFYEYREAYRHFMFCLELARRVGEQQSHYEHIVYNNLGTTERSLGSMADALEHFRLAEQWFEAKGATGTVATIRFNRGLCFMEQGNYARALKIFYEVEPTLAETYPENWMVVIRYMMECYLLLNRPHDAYTKGKSLLERPLAALTDYQKANVGLWIAKAATECGYFEESEVRFQQVIASFQKQGIAPSVVKAEMEWLKAELRQGRTTEVLNRIPRLVKHWRDEDVHYAIDGLLIGANAAQLLGDWGAVQSYAREARVLARKVNFITAQYQSHLLLGEAEVELGATHKARRHFRASIAAVERAERGLTMTLRPDFFATREQGIHRALQLELAEGNGTAVLELLERWKGNSFTAHLQRQHQWQWERTPATTPLLDKLTEVRARYFECYQRAETQGISLSDELHPLGQQIRTLTDRLYIYSAREDGLHLRNPTLTELQAHLSDNAALIEYYDDGDHLWVVVLTPTDTIIHPLSISAETVRTLVQSIRDNNRFTTQSYLPDDVRAGVQAKKIRRSYEQLGAALLAPVMHTLARWQRLYIVPYGSLHTLPFNLLRVNGAYLIEQVEVVTLPAAALLLHRSPRVAPGVRWVGYSKEGILPLAVAEVTTLHKRWGGILYAEGEARRAVLNGQPCQLLHLSTHGIHRVDHHFDLSFLELADGALYGDDLLQMSLRHELVTLSACEVGAAEAAPGGDLIGLGRAFLYAGAGAVVASLWQVREEVTLRLMEMFYTGLFAGRSKAASLRDAQLKALEAYPKAHPVYWGAFQLVGDAEQLH